MGGISAGSNLINSEVKARLANGTVDIVGRKKINLDESSIKEIRTSLDSTKDKEVLSQYRDELNSILKDIEKNQDYLSDPMYKQIKDLIKVCGDKLSASPAARIKSERRNLIEKLGINGVPGKELPEPYEELVR